MIRLASLLFPCALLFCGGNILVLSSDVNWGKKVDCSVVDGTVVCPGCNYRAGLSCPIKLEDSQNCLMTSTLPPTSQDPTIPPKTTSDESSITETTWTETTWTLPDNDSTLPEETKQQEEEEEEPEICDGNGDCPCPLICCKTGPGCPKRCVMGIRLPPPFG